jgi:NitT/TauT family transport system substrate-binding protein
VKVATLGIAPEAGMYIALDRGYFRDEGLEIELVPFQAGAEQLAALATGELHFGVGGPEPGLFNAAARGVDLRIVGHNSLVTATDASAALIVRRDLLDSGRVVEPRDLKGLTIAVNVEKSTSQLYVERILARGGLQLDDAELKLVPFTEMPVALGNRAVDAAWAVEPFVAVAAGQGLARSLVPMAEAYPSATTMVVMLSPAFARDEPEAARRFMTAHLRGQRDYWRAFVRDEGGRDDIIRILTQYTRIKDPAQYASLGWHGVDPNGALDARVLDEMQDYFVRVGSQADKLDLSRVVDLQYVNHAVERLGRLQ